LATLRDIFLGDFAMYGRSVKAFGAVGNGRNNDHPAIQAALDSDTPLITIPYGIYKISETLQISSNTRLLVHPRARLFFADGAGVDENSFLLTNKNHEAGDQNIHIEGGIWDGNNPANKRGPDEPGSYTGVLINFSHVQGLTLRKMTLRDPESYFIRFGKVTHFLVEDITFQIRHLRPNQDGVHVSGYCEDGIIRHLRGLGPQTPNDDIAALLADDALHRAQNLGAFNGPIRRIRVEDIEADSCHSFVRLLSYQNPIEDIEINNIRGGCRCCAINMDACRDCRVTLFDEGDYPEGVGHIARVKVSKMHIFRASDHSKQPLIDFRTRVQDLVVEDFRRDKTQDISPDTPTLRVTEAGEVDLVLEGLTAVQLPTLSHQTQLSEMATVYDNERYRGEFHIKSEETLELTAGGFTRLQANPSINDEADGGTKE
jgi:hypothetical protein